MATLGARSGLLLAGLASALALSTLTVGLAFPRPTDSAVTEVPSPRETAPVLNEPDRLPTYPGPKVTGWIPYWDTAAGITAAVTNANIVQEVSPFWYDIVEGSRGPALHGHSLSDGYTTRTAVNELQAAGITVLPTITDATPSRYLAGQLENTRHAESLADKIVDLVQRGQFDGIDLDWETFGFADGAASWERTRPLWTKFIKMLATRLHDAGKLLSVTSPPMTADRGGYWVYDWPGIAGSVDRLRVMAYDYSYTEPGPVGPLWWTQQTGEYAIAVFGREKVQLGVAAYGRNWVTGVDGLCPAKAVLTVTTVTAPDAEKIIRDTDGTNRWSTTDAEAVYTYSRPYRTASASCTVHRQMWYPTARALQERLDLAGKMRVWGVAVWPLSDVPDEFLKPS